MVVGLMAVCETHPLLSLPRSPFAQREQWLNPVIVRLVSLSRVTNIIWSERPACTSHHQKCKNCARKCFHLARAILRCARVVLCKVARIVQGIVFTLHEPPSSAFSGFSQSRSLSRTVVKPSRQKFNEHPVVGPSMKKFNVEYVCMYIALLLDPACVGES